MNPKPQNRKHYGAAPSPGTTNHWFDSGLGKLPPQAIDMEIAVLGAMLLEPFAIDVATDAGLTPTSFYKEAHQRIFLAIMALTSRHQPVDLLTVSGQLRSTGELEMCGGSGYLMELTNGVNSSANTAQHVKFILEAAIKRALIVFASVIMRDAYEDVTDAFGLLEAAEQQMLAIGQGVYSDVELTLHQQLTATYKAGAATAQSGGFPGVASIYTGMNRVTGSYRPTNLYYWGARPAMGKSLLVANEALGMAYSGEGVAIFSLEMSFLQYLNRILSLSTGIEHSEIDLGHAYNDPAKALILQNKVDELGRLKMTIYDKPAITLSYMRRKLRKLKAKGMLKIAFLDYLQLMGIDEESKHKNREQQISEISKGLKELAKELFIPIIALSQLSRAVETRGGDKKPGLADLRESGSLEQDADAVSFLYRPDYYNISHDESGRSTKGLLQIITEKNRSGSLDTVDLYFQPRISSITEFDREGFHPTPALSAPPAPLTPGEQTAYFNRYPASGGNFDTPPETETPF